MKPTPKLLALLGSSLLTAVTTANAQSVWKGTTNNLWTTAGNWDPSGAPGSGANVVFDGTGANLSTSFNGTAFTLGSLTFTAGQTAAVTINTVVGTPLTFNPGTVVSVATGSHKFVGTGTASSGTSRDMLFAGTTGDTFTFSIAGGASFEIQGRVATSGTTSSDRDFIKTGAGTLILSGFNGSSGAWSHSAGSGFQIQEGALRFSALNAGGFSGNNYLVSSGAALELDGGFNQGFNNGTFTLNGTGIGGNGALRSISGNNAIVGSGTGGVSLASNSSIGVDADTLTIGVAVKGSGNLTKVGSGRLTLSGTNTYSGSTTISAGTLEVRGSIVSSSGITNDASLVFNSAADQSYGNAIGGGGTLTKQNAGTLVLSANNSYTGDTTVSAGVLQVGNGGTTGTLGANSNTFIDSGAELRIDRSTGNFGYAYTGDLSGSGTVNIPASRRFNFQTNDQTASGNLSFVVDGILGINTGSGVTAVHLGELSGSGTIQRAGAAPSSPPLTVLTIGGKNTSSTYSGNIANIAEFAIEKTGVGTLTLAGSNGHGGATTVSAGTLYVSGALSNSAVTVETNGSIGSAGTLGNGLTIEAGGNLNLTGATLGLNSTGILSLTGGSLTLGNLTFQDLVGWDWANADVGTYELIDGAFSINWGSTAYLNAETAYDFNNGKKGYFTSGSLNVVVIPEPRAALLGGLGLLALLRRRRA